MTSRSKNYKLGMREWYNFWDSRDRDMVDDYHTRDDYARDNLPGVSEESHDSDPISHEYAIKWNRKPDHGDLRISMLDFHRTLL